MRWLFVVLVVPSRFGKCFAVLSGPLSSYLGLLLKFVQTVALLRLHTTILGSKLRAWACLSRRGIYVGAIGLVFLQQYSQTANMSRKPLVRSAKCLSYAARPAANTRRLVIWCMDVHERYITKSSMVACLQYLVSVLIM